MAPKNVAAFAAAALLAGLIAFEGGRPVLAQTQPSPPKAILPTAPSPAIAPVPLVPRPLKREESIRDDRPKVETSAPRKGAPPIVPTATYDVGVIPGTGWCPAGSELVWIYMDDEDHNNANSASGWIGATVADNNTRFIFCRVDGSKFAAVEGAYAVLQLSAQCPPNSFSFSRYFENEHNNNQNTYSGNISPNNQYETATGTQLFFCLFVPNPLLPGGSFPDLGMEYGVFARNLPTSGLASGHLHIDDEDNGNGNFFDLPYYAMGSWTTQIIWGTNNTDISIAKVKNAPPPPPHCLPKLTRYDGVPVSASWDNQNCFIKHVVAGATPFIWNNAYYVTADKSQTCLPGTGNWDFANCKFMPKPSGGFLYHDAFYVPPAAGNVCPTGMTINGPNCVIAAPWGTHAFEYQNTWYFTTLFTCKDGSYDSANCHIMTAPPSVTAFIYNNAFYYHE